MVCANNLWDVAILLVRPHRRDPSPSWLPRTQAWVLNTQACLPKIQLWLPKTQENTKCTSMHDVYRNTRCTSIWQEEQSALPGGVINTYLDSDDEDAYTGEQKEIVSASRTRRSMTISKRSKVAYPSPPCVLDHKVVVMK